ncbi:uncharacterized protein F5147DRAFT_541142, partial [Suillus discolor]
GGSIPGDANPWKPIPLERFTVYRVSDDQHVIIDREDRRDPEVTVPTSLLLSPRFQLANWYAAKSWRTSGPGPSTHETLEKETLDMQTPLATRVEQLLTQRGRYPGDHPDYGQRNRFECMHHSNGTYEIRDHVREFNVIVPVNLLLNEKFRLAKWYEKQLQRAHNELCERLQGGMEETNILRSL